MESLVETPVEKRWTTVVGARLRDVATIDDRGRAMTAALRVCDAPRRAVPRASRRAPCHSDEAMDVIAGASA